MEQNKYKKAVEALIFKDISKASQELGMDSYVIGGYVRDFLLQRGVPKDIDIVAIGEGIKLARKVAEQLPDKPQVKVFKNFGTAMIRHRGKELEFVGARKESYQRHSRKPIVETGTLEDDQKRRDFTINALAISLQPEDFGHLLDPFNGLQDLDDKILRTPLDPDITYSDDPLRMMRAVRFATQLGFSIHPESLKAITDNRERIKIISKERIVEELHKILACPKPSVGFSLLHKTKLLPYILPELTAL
ncbi:MAG: CCA tRNA nucleotidyltransferase, partial [Eudoraea sp.]|nr:CCA tRNA nucleotidyltransferase [Eudoraea sp.]